MLISLFFFELLLAQVPNDSLQALDIYQTADSLAAQHQYTASSKKAMEAAEAFEKLKNWSNWIDCYRMVLYNAYYAQDYSIAILDMENGIKKIPKDQAKTLAQMNYFLGFVHNETGNLFTALDYFEASIPHFRTDKDTSWLIVIYGSLGTGNTKLSDYAKAVDYLNRSVSLARTIKDTNSLLTNLYNLGKAYFYQGDLINAQKSYRAARLLFDPENGESEYLEAEIFLEQQQYRQAIKAAKKAIRLYKKSNKAEDAYTIEMEFLLGKIYLEAKRTPEALSIFSKILPAYKKGPDKRELGKLYFLIGRAQGDLGQLDQALTTYQRALQTFLPHFKESDPALNPKQEEWSREIWLMEIFNAKGYCFLKKYEQDKNKHWLLLAEKHYQTAINFIQEVKLNYAEASSKLLLGTYTQAFYEDLIQVKTKLYTLERDNKYKEEAFQIAQTANAFLLREQLNEKKALIASGVDADSIELLDKLKKEAILINRHLNAPQRVNSDSLKNLLFIVKQQQFNLKKSIEQNYPKFARLRNDLKVASAQELSEKLSSSELFIKYFLGNDTLYIFSISAQAFHVDLIPLPKNFKELITQYRRTISDLDFILKSPEKAEREFLNSAYQLFKLLLEQPINTHSKDQGINKIILATDDILNNIPFQSLLLNESDSWTNPAHFVISKYSISYTYFSKMLLEDTAPSSNKVGFISFGLEFDDYTLQYLENLSKDSIKNEAILENLRSGSLSKLPFSDDEAEELAQLMQGTPWLNEKATKLNFLKASANARMIHVATHSVLDSKNPSQSSLIFIKKKDSLDNLLRLEEIYNLRLNADMIVLSACNTGYGQRDKGEGINSLARAFNFSGIPSVTATFWNISDEASKKMMKLYYSFLKEGMPKDVALQRAQLEYLNNDKISSPAFRLPVYWAAWMTIGQSDRIEIHETSSLALIAGITVVVLFLVWILFIRKK